MRKINKIGKKIISRSQKLKAINSNVHVQLSCQSEMETERSCNVLLY